MPENVEKRRAFYEVFDTYESIGTLLHEDLIDIRMFARWSGGERCGPYIKQERVSSNYPRLWSESEYLYDRLMEFAKEHPEYQII